MRTHRITPSAAEVPPPDAHPYDLAAFIVSYLFRMIDGALFAKWDDAAGSGTWVYSRDEMAIFEAPRVDEVVWRETSRSRFRSVVFRLGSIAAEHEGDLCGVMQLFPQDGSPDPGPPGRRYIVHASFHPEAGLWLKAVVIPPPPAPLLGDGIADGAADR